MAKMTWKRKRMGKTIASLLSVLLCADMIFTSVPVYAETGNTEENTVENIAMIQAGDGELSVSENEITQEQGNEAEDYEGNDFESNRENILSECDCTDLFEPVHHCSEDYTDWDYVYFGHYPQSSVSDNNITSKIDQKLKDLGMQEGDVEVDGIRYRVFKDYNSDLECYENRYFEWEKIKWRVLCTDDNKLFLMADCGLYVKEFDGNKWINSKIRDWLNNTFYQDAFSESEQNAIYTTHLVDEKNNSSFDTDDKVFLLSYSEVTNEKYGFCKEEGEFLTNSIFPVRVMKVSEYADYVDQMDNSWTIREDRVTSWMLRTNSRWSENMYYVHSSGVIHDQFYSYGDDGAVVPAINIDINSLSWITADGFNGASILSNPVHHCSEVEDYGEYCYVYFGCFPQSIVTDEITIAALDKMREKNTWSKDFIYKGYKYRYQAESGNYYLFEKIKWKVLKIEEDGILLQSDNILYYSYYGYYSNDREDAPWEESGLRRELNGNFLTYYFSEDERNDIMTVTLNNETDAATTDKVFILSVTNVLNEKYGYCSKPYNPSGSRVIKYTDYAGVGIYEDPKRNDAHGKWWLRTPGYDNKVNSNDVATCSDQTGALLKAGDEISTSNAIGVVPSIYVDVNSNLWSIKKTEYKVGDVLDNTLEDNQENSGKKDDYESDIKDKVDQNDVLICEKKGTVIKASKLDKVLEMIPDEASFTVTSSNVTNPTVSFDGVSDENAKAVNIPKSIIYNGVEYKVTTVSLTAFDSKKDQAIYKVTNNSIDNLTVEYKGLTNKKKTKVTIPQYSTYKGIKFKVTSVSSKAFRNNKKVTQVSVASSITKIGDSCFEGCTSLKNVSLGKSLRTMGKNAFKNCKKIEKITIKSAKLNSVGRNAFKGINSKGRIKVPKKRLYAYKKLLKKKGLSSKVKVTA